MLEPSSECIKFVSIAEQELYNAGFVLLDIANNNQISWAICCMSQIGERCKIVAQLLFDAETNSMTVMYAKNLSEKDRKSLDKAGLALAIAEVKSHWEMENDIQ